MPGADNVTDCQLCPKGTFSQALGAISAATCSPCGQGKYANKTGTATELECYRCPMVSLFFKFLFIVHPLLTNIKPGHFLGHHWQ